MNVLSVKHIKKIYTTRFSGRKVEALKDINLEVGKGEFVAIMGESGSGKSTLLNLLAALDKPTSGEIELNGKNLKNIKDKDMALFRRNHLGFIFQSFNLLDTFTISENIALPLVLKNENHQIIQEKVLAAAKLLHIDHLLEKYPYEVSGGQAQRAAVARALIIKPEILLCDEPTGALDSKSSDELMKVFQDINQLGQTILMVTHSIKAASIASRVLFIQDGEVYHQLYRGNLTNQEFYTKINETQTILASGSDQHV